MVLVKIKERVERLINGEQWNDGEEEKKVKGILRAVLGTLNIEFAFEFYELTPVEGIYVSYSDVPADNTCPFYRNVIRDRSGSGVASPTRSFSYWNVTATSWCNMFLANKSKPGTSADTVSNVFKGGPLNATIDSIEIKGRRRGKKGEKNRKEK